VSAAGKRVAGQVGKDIVAAGRRQQRRVDSFQAFYTAGCVRENGPSSILTGGPPSAFPAPISASSCAVPRGVWDGNQAGPCASPAAA